MDLRIFGVHINGQAGKFKPQFRAAADFHLGSEFGGGFAGQLAVALSNLPLDQLVKKFSCVRQFVTVDLSHDRLEFFFPALKPLMPGPAR